MTVLPPYLFGLGVQVFAQPSTWSFREFAGRLPQISRMGDLSSGSTIPIIFPQREINYEGDHKQSRDTPNNYPSNRSLCQMTRLVIAWCLHVSLLSTKGLPCQIEVVRYPREHPTMPALTFSIYKNTDFLPLPLLGQRFLQYMTPQYTMHYCSNSTLRSHSCKRQS